VTVRQLSKEHQRVWIERIFSKLTAIYGDEFTRNWRGIDSDEVKGEWASALGGFEAQDIAAALAECRAQPKAPNLPEFSAMCRRHMINRVKVDLPPLTPEEKAAAAVVAEKVAEGMRANSDVKAGEYWLNGVLVTKYRTWAVNLLKREAAGEFIHLVSAEAWRTVLGYPKDHEAKAALRDLQNATA
jgi:hypothetical protein